MVRRCLVNPLGNSPSRPCLGSECRATQENGLFPTMRMPWLRILPLLLYLMTSASGTISAETVRFGYRPAEPGETVTQQVDFDLNLEMTLKQAENVIDTAKRGIAQKQRRALTVLEADATGPTKIKIAFQVAQHGISEDAQPQQLIPQPVLGKTYFVSRHGGRLQVSDEEGRTPPPDELALVTASTDTLGKPNPLARFFNNRIVAIGELLELPGPSARELLGLGQEVGSVSKFSLTLLEAIEVDGRRCAVFATEFSARSNLGTTMIMQVKGRVVMEIETCRAIELQLNGPVSLAEARGPAEGELSVESRGQIRMALQADYAGKRF